MSRLRPKKVTIADIAKKTGVSKNSVSLALRGMSGVGDELRRRIIDVAIELGYIEQGAHLDVKQDTCIIVMLPEYLHGDKNIFFYSEVVWAIDNEIQERGACSVHIAVTKEMEDKLEIPVMPKGLHVTGILAVGIFSEAYMRQLTKLDIPLLTVDIMYKNLPYVGSSNLTGSLDGVRYLIDKGHRDIGFVGPVYTAASVYERWCGFNWAMDEACLTVEPAYSIIGQREFKLFDTEDAIEPYISQMKKLPTAWFCAGDRIAIAMIHLLSKLGLQVPEDISVMGFDDIQAAQMVLPRLTTVGTDRQMMGRLAVDYFYRIKKNKGLSMVTNLVPYKIIERESVAELQKNRSV